MPGDGSLRRQAARLGRIGADRSGAIALTTVLLSTVLLGFAALAIDVSSWESAKGRMQGVADEAALSAGVALQAGQNLTLEAEAIAASAGFIAGQNQVVVTVNQPPLAGSHTADKTAIEVVISQPQTATFSQLFLQSPPTVSARAVVAQTGAGACVIVLATSGSSVTMSGSGKFALSNCDYYNDSSSSSDTLLSGTSGVSAQDVYLAGNWLGSGGSSVTATNTFKTDAPAIPDPYAGRVEPSYSGCDKSNVVVTSSQTFSASGSTPYVFCGGLTAAGSGTLTFNSGTYIFDRASITTSGTWNIVGSDVTLIFKNGSGINASGATTFKLTAETTGATAGMAIWMDKTAASSVNLSGSNALTLTGAFYGPDTTLTMSGLGSSPCTQLVVKGITDSGAGSFQHNCSGVGVSDPGAMTLVE